MIKQYKDKRKKRHLQVRAKIKGTAIRPRLSVFRSNKYIYGQIIDDEHGNTLVAASNLDKQLTINLPTQAGNKQLTKTETARFVGQELAKKTLKKNIKTVVFDRGGYKYHGRVKALAEGAREGGLKF